MRILSILYFSPPSRVFGGTERQMHSLHKGLLQQNIDVQVLASISQVGSQFQVYEGIPIWGIEFPLLTCSALHPLNIQSWINWSRMRKFIKQRIPTIDLIQATPFREAAFMAYWLSKHLKVPWIVRLAGSGANGDSYYLTNFLSRNVLTKRLIPALIETCSAVVALDDETLKEAIDIGFRKDKIVIIPNSVVLNQIPSVERAKESPKDQVCLFLGRIAPGKRVHDLIEAYSICKRKGVDAPILSIVGGGDTEYLKRMTRELLVEDRVSICGQQKDVEQFLKKAVCVINPSESEGFSNSVLEACAFGVPPILSDIPVHRRIAKHVQMEDFLFPVGDVKLIAEKIIKFHSLGTREVREKREHCAIFAEGYSQDTRNRAFIALYERVIREAQILKS